MQSEYVAAVGGAVRRAEAAGRFRAFAGILLALVALGALAFAWAASPNALPVGLIALAAGVAGVLGFFVILPGFRAGASLEAQLLEGVPIAWFDSPSHRLVVVSETAIRSDKLGTLPFDSFSPTFVASASYDEERHGLILQVGTRVRHGRSGVESESFVRRDIRLPSSFTQERAYRLARWITETTHARRQ